MVIKTATAIGQIGLLEIFPSIIDDLTTIYDPTLGIYVKRDLGGNDTLNGTANGDTIHAYDGDDVVYAGAGNDMMVDKGRIRAPVATQAKFAANGAEALNFDGSDNDYFNGGDGNDTLLAGFGANTFDGGAQTDTISYALSSKGAHVDLASGVGRGDGVDTLISVENAVGSELADFMLGDDGANQLWGRGGNDIMLGRAGADWLIGDNGDDFLDGGAGADILSGGAGVDTAQYASSGSGVIVSLATGQGYSGDAAGDILQAVENISGSAYNDALTGNSAANKLTGAGGADIVYGEGGDDNLSGGAGRDTLDGGAGKDFLSGGEDGDVLTGGVGQDTMWGGGGADVFRYTSKADFDNLEIIMDFTKGVDKIDLSLIDANPGASGNQAFVFDYDDPWYENASDALDDIFGAMTGNGPTVNGDVGEVTYRHQDGDTWVFVQLQDGDMYAQFRLDGTISLSASDFVL